MDNKYERFLTTCPDCGKKREAWNMGNTVTCPHCGSHNASNEEIEEAFWGGVDKAYIRETGHSGMITEKDADYVVSQPEDADALVDVLKGKPAKSVDARNLQPEKIR